MLARIAQRFVGVSRQSKRLHSSVAQLQPKAEVSSPDSHQLRPIPVVTPVFTYNDEQLMNLTSLAEMDCSDYNMSTEELSPSLVSEIKETYERNGLVVLRNTGLTDLADMRRWALLPMNAQTDYSGGANYRDSITLNVYDTGAPYQANIHYHHEMAYLNHSITAVAFCCRATCATPNDPLKGGSYLSNSVQVTDYLLDTEFGQKLKSKGVCYIRCLTDKKALTEDHVIHGVAGSGFLGVYNTWQSCFMTEDRDEAEELANRKGLNVEWGPGDYMRTKHYSPAYEYLPELDRNVLYCSIADHSSWFDTWPGICDLPQMPSYAEATPQQRPLAMTFGDDSQFSDDDLHTFVEAYDRFGFAVPWNNVGDIAVVCNYRYAHGRPHFTLNEGERRELGVVLGPMFNRGGQNNGKW